MIKSRGTILYIANQFPFGNSEAFIWPEVSAHMNAGYTIKFCPLRKASAFHGWPNLNLNDVILQPLFSLKILITALVEIIKQPSLLAWLYLMAFKGRPKVIFRNLVTIPKGIWLGYELKKHGVSHIHAHWLSAPATMAMIASKVSGVPFSVTAHRIDISQQNLIPEKIISAKFIRAIDTNGQKEIIALHPSGHAKVKCIYLGTAAFPEPKLPVERKPDTLRVVTAARLVEKKGHEFLIRAAQIAKNRGVNLELDFFGDGPLEGKLKKITHALNLHETIHYRGNISHSSLQLFMNEGRYDVAILPSVTSSDDDREGIPAFLMEAMAQGLAVIATTNGGIAELVDQDTGILVNERDVNAISDALLVLNDDVHLRENLGRLARERILLVFNVAEAARKLRHLMLEDDDLTVNEII